MQQIAELDRKIGSLISIGTIAALDEAKALVKVNIGDLTTDWLPWGAARAGNTRQWSPPRVDEQVMVLAPSGDMSQAVVGHSIFQDDNPAPAASKDQEHIIFPDGSTVDYNSATNTLTVSVAGDGNVILNCKAVTVNTQTAHIVASDHVTLTTPQTNISGNVAISGNAHISGSTTIDGSTTLHGITSNGKNISDSHTHGGVSGGLSNTAVVN